MPPNSQTTDYQSRLAWAYSLYAGAFAFVFSIAYFSPLSGVQFAALAGLSALVCARIAAWIAGYFGRSGYGLVACAITAILFPLVPPAVTVFYFVLDYFQSGILTGTTIKEYAVLFSLYYIIGIQYAAPAALAATLIFHLALVAIRKQQWLTFQHRWI